MIDKETGRYLMQEYELLDSLLTQLKEEPAKGMELFFQNRDALLEAMKQAGARLDRWRLQRLHVKNIVGAARKVTALEEFIQELATIGDAATLRQRSFLVMNKVNDKELTQRIQLTLRHIATLPDEIKMFEKLLILAQKLEVAWKDPAQRVQERVGKLYASVSEKLPAYIEKKFHDRETAEYIRKRIKHGAIEVQGGEEKFKQIVPQPVPLRVLFQNRLQFLQHEGTGQGLLQKTKQELAQTAQEEIVKIHEGTRKAAKKVWQILQGQYHKLAILNAKVIEDLTAASETEGKAREFISVLQGMINLSKRQLAILEDPAQTPVQLQEVSKAYHHSYAEYAKQLREINKEIAKLGKKTENRYEIVEEAVKKLAA